MIFGPEALKTIVFSMIFGLEAQKQLFFQWFSVLRLSKPLFCRTCCPSRRQRGSKTAQDVQDDLRGARKTAQHASLEASRGPRGAKMPQQRPKRAPKTSQRRPKSTPEGEPQPRISERAVSRREASPIHVRMERVAKANCGAERRECILPYVPET